MINETKACNTCGKELPLNDFYQLRSSKDGRHNKCKQCTLEAQKQRKQKRLKIQNPPEERHPAYKRLKMQHGNSSAEFYLRLVNRGLDPKTAERLAAAAYNDNGRYCHLRDTVAIKRRLMEFS